MNRFAVVLLSVIVAGCANAPKPPQPTGPWVPVNHPHDAAGSNR